MKYLILLFCLTGLIAPTEEIVTPPDAFLESLVTAFEKAVSVVLLPETYKNFEFEINETTKKKFTEFSETEQNVIILIAIQRFETNLVVYTNNLSKLTKTDQVTKTINKLNELKSVCVNAEYVQLETLTKIASENPELAKALEQHKKARQVLHGSNEK